MCRGKRGDCPLLSLVLALFDLWSKAEPPAELQPPGIRHDAELAFEGHDSTFDGGLFVMHPRDLRFQVRAGRWRNFGRCFRPRRRGRFGSERVTVFVRHQRQRPVADELNAAMLHAFGLKIDSAKADAEEFPRQVLLREGTHHQRGPDTSVKF